METDALFFGTHPDDVEICCGGLVTKLCQSGYKTGIIDLTRGELSTRGNLKIRSRETDSASKILGITYRENLNFEDGNLQNNEKNRYRIIQKIRYHRPGIIFLPVRHDRHPDHINASILIKEAAFFSGLKKIVTNLNGDNQESYRPRVNVFYMQTYPIDPSFIIDISKEFNNKMKAIKCFASQFYNPRNKSNNTFISDRKFLRYIEARARFYGFQIGAEYGEPYLTEKNIKLQFENLFEL